MRDHWRVGYRVSIHAPARGDANSTRAMMFRSTPLREGRHHAANSLSRIRLFRSTPLCEGRAGNSTTIGAAFQFRSTPLREGRLLVISGEDRTFMFRSTPLREGRPDGSMVVNRPKEFRSTPLREGRRAVPVRSPYRHVVSIHAPARGATPIDRRGSAARRVSIHAPARGATPRSSLASTISTGFDPRPCARGDKIGYAGPIENLLFRSKPQREGRLTSRSKLRIKVPVSIHAPARGRLSGVDHQIGVFVSIHAPARGATPAAPAPPPPEAAFRSTPPREGRPQAPQPANARLICFDPRPCARGDRCTVGDRARDGVSIHAPARGRPSMT